jgi:type I restriction enzyme, S subunit
MKTKIADLVQEVDERHPEDGAVVFSVSEKYGIVPQAQLFEKSIATDDRSKYRRIRFGDVVYNPYLLWNRAVGVCFDRRGGCVSPAYIVLRPREPNTERFLHYFFRSDALTTAVDAIATGSVTRRRTVPVSAVLALTFELPPPADQKAANAIVGTLDDKIELNQRMNETLEAMARALFKSWFMDFDPVRAKAKGCDPSLPKPFADLFPDSFEDSKLGEIPKGWAVGTLGDVASSPRRGIQPADIDPLTPYIALEHMPRRSITLSEWCFAEGLESNKLEFKSGEILFGKLRPYLHKVGVAPLDGVCSTDIVVVTPSTPEWFGFVLGHLSSDTFVEHANAGSTGTKMPRTSWGDMARYPLVIPLKPVADAFTNQIRAAVNRTIAGIHQSRTLAAVRDTLLPKLIFGEVRLNPKGTFPAHPRGGGNA